MAEIVRALGGFELLEALADGPPKRIDGAGRGGALPLSLAKIHRRRRIRTHMTSALNITGLLLNSVAAAMLLFFPPHVQQYTKDGAAIATWTSQSTDESRRRARWQLLLSRSGIGALLIGFLLQLVGALLAS